MVADGDWWRRWIEPPSNGSHAGNRTGDVICANCVFQPDSIACVRSGLMAMLAVLTAGCAMLRIVHLHSTQPSPLKLLLYFILTVHCIAGSFEWLVGWTTQLALAISYAKAIELLIICYFYLDIASKVMHWSSAAGRRLCFSALFLMFTYFTLFLTMGLFLSIEPWTDCHAPYWIWFAGGEFIVVQLTVGSFLLIFRRLNNIAASPNICASQKRDLWSLFWTFETSALADLSYHISLFLLANDEDGCSGVFHHDQLRYTLLKAPYDVVSFLLPVWAILYVFRPTPKPNVYDDADTESLHSSRASSVSSIADVVVVRNWGRRYRPLTQSVQERPVLPQSRRARASTTNTTGRLRPSNSAPSMALPRRASISRSLVSSPLYSIPEELMEQHLAAVESNPLLGRSAAHASLDRLSTSAIVDDES